MNILEFHNKLREKLKNDMLLRICNQSLTCPGAYKCDHSDPHIFVERGECEDGEPIDCVKEGTDDVIREDTICIPYTQGFLSDDCSKEVLVATFLFVFTKLDNLLNHAPGLDEEGCANMDPNFSEFYKEYVGFLDDLCEVSEVMELATTINKDRRR